MNAYELLGQAIGALCSWLVYIAGRLLRRGALAATVGIVVIAGGVWATAAVVPQSLLFFKTALGAHAALADCKFSIPRNGEFGPGCECRTISQASFIYIPNKNGELIAQNRTDERTIGSDMSIDIYGFSQKYSNYLYEQQTWVWDADTKRSMRWCSKNNPARCTVGLIAADRIVQDSCHYER